MSEAKIIGTARIDVEGTLKLMLRLDQGGMIGDGVVTYKKGSPHYQEVLDHIGPIKPGEQVPVKEWVDK
jgi:hypothetical protein